MLNSQTLTKAEYNSKVLSTRVFLSKYFDSNYNEGELVSFDYVVSETGELYLLEMNTDLALTDLMVFGQTTFDFDKINKRMQMKEFERVKLVCRDENKQYNPEPEFIKQFTKEIPNSQVIYQKGRQEFEKEDNTYYIKNLPTTEHGKGIITISRRKNLFRDFLKKENRLHLMPKCNYNETKYREQYIKPKVDEYGNPITIKSLFLIDSYGPTSLRKSKSKPYWSEIINLKGNPTYVDKNPRQDNMFDMKFENSTFNKTGIWAQLGGETNVKTERGLKQIQDISIGDKVVVSELIKGNNYQINLNDDTMLNQNRKFKDYKSNTYTEETNLAKVSNIHKFNFRTWVKINNICISPVEYIFINRNNTFQFVKSLDVQVGDKLLNQDVVSCEIVNEEKTFYGLQIEGYDNIMTTDTIITTIHHLPKA